MDHSNLSQIFPVKCVIELTLYIHALNHLETGVELLPPEIVA